MKRILFTTFAFLLISIWAGNLKAQDLQEKRIKVHVTPDHEDWKYKLGEKVKFKVIILKNNMPLDNISVSYELSEDVTKPIEKKTAIAGDKFIMIDGGTLRKPGFLRCKVSTEYDGNKYDGMCTVAYEPEKITAKTKLPVDFLDFWTTAKEESSKIPMDARIILQPEKCTEEVDVYKINIQSYRMNNRLYGVLCIPKGGGKYPAVLRVPGAGIRGYNGDSYNAASKKIITLEIGIHGIPVNLDPQVYLDLRNGALRNYQLNNLENKDEYYYKRVFLGCVRAIDFLTSLPEFDGKNMIVRGGSQGGALSIVTAALDSRVTGLVSFYPALCNIAGGGWPRYDLQKNGSQAKIETSYYYDVVNFARLLKVPGFYSFGYNDVTCPPSSVYSAFNVIDAPKEYFIVEEAGHRSFAEQNTNAWKWIMNQIKR